MKSVKLVAFMLVAMLFSASVMAVSPIGKHTLAGGAILIVPNGTTATIDYNTVFSTYDLCIAAKDKLGVEAAYSGSSAYSYMGQVRYMLFVDCFQTTTR